MCDVKEDKKSLRPSTKKLISFDWAMKYILRNKANFDVLEAFISNLIKEDIKIENLIESESNQKSKDDKFNRVDLRCIDSKGRQIIVEIQNQREVDYLQRILWGTSKAIEESIEIGDDFENIVKVISISILYHDMRQDEKENLDFIYYGTTNIVGMHTGEPLILHHAIANKQKVPIVTSKEVFPEYYMIYAKKFNDMIQEDLDEWIFFFKYGKIRSDFKSPGILLAAKKLDYLAASDEDRTAYDEYLIGLSRERSILETAKEEGMEKGREEGLQKGIEKGLQEGLQKGIEKGLQEGTLNVAKKMLEGGMAVEVVSKYTGLDILIINQLKH